MASTHVQYQVTKQGGPFARATVPTPTPGPKEVLIQLKAIALNPVDNKRIEYGLLIDSWPAVIGIDGAGIVTAVGSDVTRVKPGDEVIGVFFDGPQAASYQEAACLPEHLVAKKPANTTFEEAATLAICYMTAAACMATTLKIPLPFLPGGVTEGLKHKSVLVLGGSSWVGGSAIQLLRLALPDAVILTTSSPKHHAKLKALGATAAFDQKSKSLVEDIKAATPGGKGVDVILDGVGGAEGIFDVLDPDGPKLDAEVMTGAVIHPPEGVTRDMIHGPVLFDIPGGKNALPALTELVSQGKYKVPFTVNVVGTGFEAIDEGLRELKAGVSGAKLVVSL